MEVDARVRRARRVDVPLGANAACAGCIWGVEVGLYLEYDVVVEPGVCICCGKEFDKLRLECWDRRGESGPQRHLVMD